MLDAGMQARGKAHISRVLGKPKHSRRGIVASVAGSLIVVAGASYFFWPDTHAPGADQLGRLTVLSACEELTPGQAWLDARSAAGADGSALTSDQRRVAMDYLLGGEHAVGCESLGSPNNDGEPLAFPEGD
jgi:hypothetical protein